jgi:hypothetical protein
MSIRNGKQQSNFGPILKQTADIWIDFNPLNPEVYLNNI